MNGLWRLEWNVFQVDDILAPSISPGNCKIQSEYEIRKVSRCASLGAESLQLAWIPPVRVSSVTRRGHAVLPTGLSPMTGDFFLAEIKIVVVLHSLLSMQWLFVRRCRQDSDSVSCMEPRCACQGKQMAAVCARAEDSKKQAANVLCGKWCLLQQMTGDVA